MERKMGLSSARALANASSPHAYQSTGLAACWRRYGLRSRARRFIRTMLTYNSPFMELAVETRGLARTFGSVRAVDGIDLHVPAGSLYGFLGPNGAGKSTTIKCLTGLLRPSAGEMRILGMDPIGEAVAVKRRIGVVPEDLALFERLTAGETLAFVGQVHGMS